MAVDVDYPLIRIAFVEDNDLAIRLLSKILQSQRDFRLIGALKSVREANQWLDANEPDVLLVDLELPDGSGLDVIKKCASRYPRCNIMVVTASDDEPNVLSSIQVGAKGYILKSSLLTSVIDGIRTLANGGSPINPIIARQILQHLTMQEQVPYEVPRENSSEEKLSCRESHVLKLIAHGYTYAEIAASLNISINTVQTHIKRIYEKLAVHSRTDAINKARERGWI
jgi:DNA-binding NarL/FixJ family response regulator